jgi:hypothetical protein
MDQRNDGIRCCVRCASMQRWVSLEAAEWQVAVEAAVEALIPHRCHASLNRNVERVFDPSRKKNHSERRNRESMLDGRRN